MESQDFSKQWPEKKVQLKKEHPELTEDDLYYELGKEVELLERIQKKLGRTKEEIRNWLHIMG